MSYSKDLMESFTAPDCNRMNWIAGFLESAGINPFLVRTGDSNHILVKFRPESYNAMFKFKTVLVHYDRFPGSPGANDNSSSVLAVLDWALRLKTWNGVHNVRIFFTDGEEMGGQSSAGVSSQGAYGLASLYKKMGITNDDIYVFDCCGRGTIPVLAQTDFSRLNPKSPFTRNFASLYERTKALLQIVSPHKWLNLPVPYSDNAGFLACGIPAVAITFLPADEAQKYIKELMKDKNLENAVMNRAKEESSLARGKTQILPDFMYKEKMPMTWRLLHSQYDNVLSLNPESFELMEKLLDTLARQKFPA